MRRNFRRRPYEDRQETRKILIISFSVLLIAVLAFIVTYFIYSNHLNKNQEIAEFKGVQIAEATKESTDTDSSIGRSINEVKEEKQNKEVENTQKIAINTSNIEKTNNIETNTQTLNKQDSNTTKSNTANRTSTKNNTQASNVSLANEKKKKEIIKDPTFKMPVEGNITVKFAKDTSVYSNTLQEWVIHTGIDIEADKTTVVKASADGTVKSIKNDPRYGITVVIEHANGYNSVYSNLLTAEFVKEGESVKQGQTIGTVGNTATFEIADNPHLHFEILKNNENVDPEQYLKK